MGQQQSSLAAKGAHHPSLSHKIADSPAESVQMEDTSFQQQQPNNAQLTPPASTADLTAGVSSSSQVCTMEVQSKSVRAAIDSFIENCLAGGSDNGTPPPQIRVDEDRGQSSDVEICEVIPTEGKHVAGSPATDDKHKNSASTSGQSGAHEHQSSVLSQEDVQESSQRDPSIGQQPETETGTTAAEDSVSVKNKIDCQTESQADKPGADDQNTVSEKSSRAGGAKGPAGTVDNSKSNQGEDSNQSKGTTDDSSDGDGVVSVRFKTIIDRVLDTSLGIGPDLSSIPHEQRILSQLAADEKAAATRSTMAVSDVSNKKDNSSTSSEKKIEPMAVCFMDHIEKAVERSFSSITEEEERKEKEKALAAREAMREADGKQPSWGTRQAKTETSGGDSTISVQDIVDRVISQTEVISKLMTTSAGASSQTDTKPTATAAGTFYPSR
ncbi:hypothetical protein BaRGS_00026261 [Batillaria attramentaria]|uniref:Uncharacterized protein n=1 Tax=Batillaria attramentaria TaxID=370345 RepID=A0ABD0K5R3_9CAEN